MLSYFRVPLGWSEIARRTFTETIEDNCLGLAAQLAYYFFLSLFPALLFAVALASYFPVQDLIDQIVGTLAVFAPREVLMIVRDQITKIAQGERGGILTFAFLFTIWSSSAAMVSVIDTLNSAYDIQESRPWWKTRLLAIGLTVALSIFILISFALVLVGPTLAEGLAQQLGLGAAFEWTWKILQWPLIFVLVVTAIGLIYYFAPDAEQEWVWITPGSLLATVLWFITSLGFKYYVGNFADYNETYGAIGGIMVLLLWFYLSGLAILIGAELNAEIEHASPYGKDPGEKAAGEKKVIGAAAERAWEEREAHRRSGAPTLAPASPQAPVNCALEQALNPAPALARGDRRRARASDLVLGSAALLPILATRWWRLSKKTG